MRPTLAPFLPGSSVSEIFGLVAIDLFKIAGPTIVAGKFELRDPGELPLGAAIGAAEEPRDQFHAPGSTHPRPLRGSCHARKGEGTNL
jgi:hypothetical protein